MGRILFDWEYYHNHLLEIPYVWQGGMSIQGGIIFACIAAYFYLKKNQIPVLPFADTVTPGIVLGQAVGRIANFMNGDAFGHPTGQDFGLLYPDTTLAYHTYGSQPLWPAEVWECQGDLLILFCFSGMDAKYGQKELPFVSISCFILSFASFLKITEAITEHSFSV